MKSFPTPKWQEELNTFKGIKSTFIVEGNIHDRYPYATTGDDGEERVDFFSFNSLITRIFDSGATEGFYEFLFCDPLRGFYEDSHTKIHEYEPLLEEYAKEVEGNLTVDDNVYVKNSELIRAALTYRQQREDDDIRSVAIVLDLASRFTADLQHLADEENAFFLNLLYASLNACRGKTFINTLIVVVDKSNDVPAWFYYNNPNVRTVSIPNPDRTARSIYIDRAFKFFQNQNIQDLDRKKKHFVDLTDGMKILELFEIKRLFQLKKATVDDVDDIMSIYKYGFKDNKWLQMRENLGDDIEERIRERVKGQDVAVQKVIAIIKRAVIGLSGMQHSSDSKPRGIMFLAGPTGTGKTELVKTITELLFGDERSLIRFDMSEYSAEHSDQKLFGAPPGYVGYGQGGQLTNAVKNNPFSVVLFDEIEKAHPSIMDKFLQILEDGRLTDGQGQTVYFSETLIFFTSNVGISYENVINGEKVRVFKVKPGEPYNEIEKKVRDAMKANFKPEVLNRIGDNILVFDYIDEKTTKEIVDSRLSSINKNLMKTHEIDVQVDNNAKEWFYSKCCEDEPRQNGGRGIGNVIESQYINPLAVYIYDHHVAAGDSLRVTVSGNAIEFQGA